MPNMEENNLGQDGKKKKKRVSIKQCITTVLVCIVVAFALILIVSALYQREEDLAEDRYTFEYGEDALARLKSEIDADKVVVNFQTEENMGYPKLGRYTGIATKGSHSETFTVLIEDTVAPEFTSSVESLVYNTGEGSVEAILSNFDASDVSGVVELNMQGDVDFKTAGSYDITISASDNSRNTSTVDCLVTIKEVDGGAYDVIQSKANRQSDDYVEYTDERQVNRESHLTIDVVGIDLDIEERDSSKEYFMKEFEEDDVCLFTLGLSEPGEDGSTLIGGGTESFVGLHSINAGNDITVYWEGKEYHYTTTVSEECEVRGNSVISLSSGENVFSMSDDNVLQLYTRYSQGSDNSIWFVRAELVS